MDLHKWESWSITFVALLTAASEVDSGKDESKTSLSKTGRFKDIAQAINFLKENMPANMSFDEQCERYAVFADIAVLEKLPRRHTVLGVATMDVKEVKKRYVKLDVYRIGYVYMVAIDRYRVTQLAPPMLDLIACLIQIDTPEVMNYLSNRELVVISHLYKQILECPAKQIELGSLNLNRLRPAFRRSLGNLFREYFDIDAVLNDASISTAYVHGISNSTDPLNIAETSSTDLQSGDQSQQDSQLRDLRRREMERLKQLRRRTAYPEVREKNRLYQRERRQLMKRNRESTSKPETEVESSKRERRERRNEMRRRRYRLKREQRSEQKQLSNLIRLKRTYHPHKEGEWSPRKQQYASPNDTQAPSIPATPEEQMGIQQVSKRRRPEPLGNSLPSCSQSYDCQRACSPSLHSPFLHDLQTFDSNTKQKDGQQIDGRAQAHTNPSIDLQNRPSAGREERTVIHQEQMSEDTTDEYIKYLLDDPQTNETFDELFEALSKSRSPD